MLTDSRKLEELLLKQLKHLKSLADSAEIKKNAIIQNQTDRLDQIAQEESFIIAQIKEIEDSKTQLFEELSTEEFPIKTMKLNEIATCYEKSAGDKIIKLQKAIRTVMNDINTKNRRNADLLLYAIDHFNSFFQLLFSHQNPPNGYTPKGLQNREVISSNMFLDKRA